MFRSPPHLVPGDLVAVVAPSGPFDAAEVWRGLAWLRGRYRLRGSTGLFARTGYLAGSDARRADELARAMGDPEVRAIVCARGGYGSMRIVDALPWAELARRPKWIVGFSDVTALHACAAAHGVMSVHGPNVSGLGRDVSPWVRYRWLAALEGLEPPAWEGLRIVRAGSAAGPLVGGNLALVHAMCAAGRVDLPEGAILALEDVTEKPYRLDRMLTALRLGGHTRRLAGVVFGAFSECEPGKDGVTAERVLEEWGRSLGVPVVAGAPFGHIARNEAFVLGAEARIEPGRVVLGAR
jgi:muramoyltetrapeptide carboxypeptidase